MFKTFKDILTILLGSIVVKKWVFLYNYVFCHFLTSFFLFMFESDAQLVLRYENIGMSLLFSLFVGAVPLIEFYLR